MLNRPCPCILNLFGERNPVMSLALHARHEEMNLNIPFFFAAWSIDSLHYNVQLLD